MPFEYQRDDELQRISIRMFGRFEVGDVFEIVDRHCSEQVAGYALLYDLTQLAGTPSGTDIHHISNYVQRRVAGRPRGPVAVVAGPRSTVDVVQSYSMTNPGGVRVGVFQTLLEAERWLQGQRLTAFQATSSLP